MATGNFRVVEGRAHTNVWQVDDRDTSSATTIAAGEFTKTNATAAPYAVPLVDADLTIGTDQTLVGLAAKASTETASANGTVEVIVPLPDLVYEGRVLTTTLADTQSEVDALVGDYLVLDLTSSTWTIDTAAGTGANNAFLIIGGDPLRSTLKFRIRSDATNWGRAQV